MDVYTSLYTIFGKILRYLILLHFTVNRGKLLILNKKKDVMRRLVTGYWPALQDSNLGPTA